MLSVDVRLMPLLKRATLLYKFDILVKRVTLCPPQAAREGARAGAGPGVAAIVVSLSGESIGAVVTTRPLHGQDRESGWKKRRFLNSTIS